MRFALLGGIVLLVSGCAERPTAPAEGAPATLAVRWSGKFEGSFVAPATAIWCPGDSMVQISAIRSDTGVGLALFTPDTVRPGEHPVVAPEVGATWRPLAFASVRWFTESEIMGFTATGGVVSLTGADSGATGTLDVRLRAPNQMDTLHLTGTFTRVPISPATGACGRVGKQVAG